MTQEKTLNKQKEKKEERASGRKTSLRTVAEAFANVIDEIDANVSRNGEFVIKPVDLLPLLKMREWIDNYRKVQADRSPRKGRNKQPDNEVSANALYKREYRKGLRKTAKAEVQETSQTDRPRIVF